jgi:hypothetical protein
MRVGLVSSALGRASGQRAHQVLFEIGLVPDVALDISA